jgi:glycosyltransferase involved in cell wall biosynthesis
MHILFLTDNFPPEVNAPASRTFEHAREWVKAGHQVTIITCAPNFPRGKVYDGYSNKLWQREDIEGISVVRVWTYISANEGFFKRTLDYLSFMAAGSFAGLQIRGVDIVVGTSPQFFTAFGAFVVGLVKRRPWVFELRDIWPESIKTVGVMKDGPLISVLEALEKFLYRRASRIVAVTHSFKTSLVQRGIPSDKIDVVTNGADLSRFAPRPKPDELVDKLGLRGCFVAGYVGTHGLAHGLETLLDAAERLSAVPQGASIRIVMLGDGARKRYLVDQAQQRGLDNVIFLESVPKDAAVAYLALLDVSIIHLKRDPLFTAVIPSKLFECMAMGVPVLHGVEGESADIVLAEQVGEVFEPENAQQLCEALIRLAKEPEALAAYSQRAIEAAKKYDRAHLAHSMLCVLENVAGTDAPSSSNRSPFHAVPQA